MVFEKISARDINENVFTMIGEKWLLITAGDESGYNTMTASWGGLGVLWGADVATCYIRHSRYTLGFMEKGEYYTLSFYGEQYKKHLGLLGKKSGRDTNKIGECGFNVRFAECGAPYFDEAELVLVCRKKYSGEIEPDGIPEDVKARFYADSDYHKMYIDEIVETLVKHN